jgi:lipid-A-disaccharide synthase
MMAKIIDRLMVIFPFEVDVFKDTALHVDYVGHPLVREIDRFLLTEPTELPWQGEKKIALLPGSRHQEVSRILPVMLKAAQQLEQEHQDAEFIVPVPNERVEADVMQRISRSLEKPRKLEVVKGKTRETLRQADAALVTSGTATLETALIGCPMVVMYKARPFTVFLARKLVNITHICIVNIIAGRTVVSELIQQDASPEALTAGINGLLDDAPERAAMLAGYKEVREILGDHEAGERVAEIILNDA